MYYTRFDTAITAGNPRLLIIGELEPMDGIYGLHLDSHSFVWIRENYPNFNPLEDLRVRLTEADISFPTPLNELQIRFDKITERPVKGLTNYLARAHERIAKNGKFDLILLSNIFGNVKDDIINDVILRLQLIANNECQIIFSLEQGHNRKQFTEAEIELFVEKFIHNPLLLRSPQSEIIELKGVLKLRPNTVRDFFRKLYSVRK